MRIQHNIMAMNAYRNYNNNTSALSKNLEKLSSGYKINRAGDDAAGLAISEKMRAQITGLDVAQKNAKDGISLVQTAEGALTEVHDMLNRMYELAEKSANGTYGDFDRTQLQKEVTALNEEIDRISETANFNGIKLFTGGAGGGGDAAGGGNAAGVTVTMPTAKKPTETTAPAGGATGEYAFDMTGVQFAGDGTVTVGLGGKTYDVAVTDGMTAKDFVDALETEYNKDKLNGGGTAGDIAFTNGNDGKFTLKAAGNGTWTGVTLKDVDITIEAKPAAAKAAPAGGAGGADAGVNVTQPNNPTPTEDQAPGVGNKGKYTFDMTGIAFDKAGTVTVSLGDKTYEVDVTDTMDAKAFVAALKTKYDADKLTDATGGDLVFTPDGTGKFSLEATNTGTWADITLNGQDIAVAPKAGDADAGGNGKFILQIGENEEAKNRLEFDIKKIDTATLKTKDVNIGTQNGALDSLKTIRDAIDEISGIRGDLGAIQNRLDHTINNLGVMHENIQDAEATIRDTDVAAEMMSYTKNNILIQSAQAMLAQANQVPQGVLQLLQ